MTTVNDCDLFFSFFLFVRRYLANKCSIAARIDTFSDTATSAYGERLRSQVEERLEFYKLRAKDGETSFFFFFVLRY
jgi:hypothetical protein